MNTRFAIVGATIAALAAPMIGSFAHAQSADRARSVKVHYGDLNMSSPEGRLALTHRIRSAAYLVCNQDEGDTDLNTHVASVLCAQRAMIDAQKAIASRMGVIIATR